MQNPSAIRTKSRSASVPARELSWSFMLLVIVCACVVAAGFFFAARQHFTSMDYGIKNSKLREQLQNLETEKRRLLLAREVALSPLSIRKAAAQMGMRQRAEIVAIEASARQPAPKTESTTIERAMTKDLKPTVIKTALTASAQSKSSGETRGRVVDTKKDKAEVAALLKLR